MPLEGGIPAPEVSPRPPLRPADRADRRVPLRAGAGILEKNQDLQPGWLGRAGVSARRSSTTPSASTTPTSRWSRWSRTISTSSRYSPRRRAAGPALSKRRGEDIARAPPRRRPQSAPRRGGVERILILRRRAAPSRRMSHRQGARSHPSRRPVGPPQDEVVG